MCDMDIGEALSLYRALTSIHELQFEQVKSMARNLLVKSVVVPLMNDERTSTIRKYAIAMTVFVANL